MTGQPQDLVSLEHIGQLLAEVRTIDEIKNIRRKPQLARGYAKKKGLAQEIIVDGSENRLEAERRLRRLLRKTPLAKASAGNQQTGKLDRSHTAWPTLARPPPKGLAHDEAQFALRLFPSPIPDQGVTGMKMSLVKHVVPGAYPRVRLTASR